MHEAKIASLILQKAAAKVADYGDNGKVICIQLALGKFRNVDTESLLFAFDSIKGEIKSLSEAVLDIEEIEAKVFCEAAGHGYVLDLQKGVCCPLCGSGVGKFESGQELEIRKVQLTKMEHEDA